MRYFTLLWDPKQDPDYREVFERFSNNGSAMHRFSCGNQKNVEAGDRVILRQVGAGPRGVVGVGTANTRTYQADSRNFIDVHWGQLSANPLIHRNDPRWQHVAQLWNAMAGGQIIAEVWGEAIYESVLRGQADAGDERLLLREGSLVRRSARGYNRSVRDLCLDHYGAVCFVCKFNPSQLEGEFEFLMDVHHLVPMAQMGGDARETDPVADCRPLCPTCHRMAHHGMPIGTCRSIDELKKLRGL